MSWTSYIAAMSEHLGFPIDFSNHTCAAFQVDMHQFYLQWTEATQSFLFYRELGHLVPHIDGELAKDLLAANFLLAETDGATLSYDKSANMVGINKSQPIADLTPEDFLVRLNNFFALAQIWEAQMAEYIRRHEYAQATGTTETSAGGDAQDTAADLPEFLKV